MIDPHYFDEIFLFGTIALTFYSLKGMSKESYGQIEQGKNNSFLAVIIAAFFAILLGNRDQFWLFGDSVNYAHHFELAKYQTGEDGLKGEWLWMKLMNFTAQIGDVHTFFLIVSIGYFGYQLWACRRFTPNNVLISYLFVLGAFSAYSYATNGIRNGLACAMLLTALSYFGGNKKDKIIAAAIAFFAVAIHKSVLIPITMAVVSMYCIKSFKQAYGFWLFSIVLSLVLGGAISNFIAGLGFDDERVSYLTNYDDGQYTNISFRWDFLLYSMMPIVLGYYVVIKRGIQDKTYLLLLNTYTLSNAFWVMVIRANYSNRFAYLSWFMYPIVLAYPLLKLDIWEEQQGKYLKRIMLAQIAFTWIMNTIYKT